MHRLTLVIVAVVVAACSPAEPVADDVSTTSSTATTTPAVTVEAAWEAMGFDLHGLVRIEADATIGVSARPAVTDDGTDTGPGLVTVWLDESTPEDVAAIEGADCSTLPRLLDRWADVLYRLDVDEGQKAQADAYLGFGMDRVDALGCAYEPDLEGRASPFP